MSLRADLALKTTTNGNLTRLTLPRPFAPVDLYAIFDFANGMAFGQVLIALPSNRTGNLDLYLELATDRLAFCENHDELPRQIEQSL